MEPIIIDGKKISSEIKDECREKVEAYKAQGIEICMAVIQVGSDPASSVYVNNKKKACKYIGIESFTYKLEENTSQKELLHLIDELNYIVISLDDINMAIFHTIRISKLC